jgi:hypothetical protein
MSFLAGLVGSGVAIIALGGAMIALGYVNHLPKWAHSWVHRFLAVVVYGGASLLALTGAGQLWLGIVHWVEGFTGPGAAAVAITLGSFIMILGLIVGMWKAPTAALVTAALVAPMVLMLTTSGFIHSFWLATSAPAQNVANQFVTWLGS